RGGALGAGSSQGGPRRAPALVREPLDIIQPVTRTGSCCIACGDALKPDSRFCSGCGRATAPGRRLRFRPWMVAPAVLLAVLLVALPGLLYVWAGLPSTSNLSTARLPLSTRIYDRTGTVLLAEIHQGSERRHLVPLKQVA